MADFSFINIPALRTCLESDYQELQLCLKAEAWKAVHVLAGSLIEAVLIDALHLDRDENDANPDRMTLEALAKDANDKGFLSEATLNLTTVVRQYRNLIHPGRVKRLEKVVDRSGAVVAAELVEMITNEVSTKRKETYGYTAEQLLQRLRGGPSALPLTAHLLAETRVCEVERLLTKVIPDAYMDAMGDINSSREDENHLAACYREVFKAAPDTIKANVMRHVFTVYRDEQEYIVLMYEDVFLHISDLRYIGETERTFIKAHLLPRVKSDNLDVWLKKLVGIGRFLDPSEAEGFASTLLLGCITTVDKELPVRITLRLKSEYAAMTAEARERVWAIVREIDSHSDDSKFVDRIRTALSNIDERLRRVGVERAE